MKLSRKFRENVVITVLLGGGVLFLLAAGPLLDHWWPDPQENPFAEEEASIRDSRSLDTQRLISPNATPFDFHGALAEEQLQREIEDARAFETCAGTYAEP